MRSFGDRPKSDHKWHASRPLIVKNRRSHMELPTHNVCDSAYPLRLSRVQCPLGTRTASALSRSVSGRGLGPSSTCDIATQRCDSFNPKRIIPVWIEKSRFAWMWNPPDGDLVHGPALLRSPPQGGRAARRYQGETLQRVTAWRP